MANTCEENLHLVKKEKEKYQIHVFNEKLSWDNFGEAIKNGNKLIEYMEMIPGFSRGFLYKLLTIKRMKQDFVNGRHVLKNGKWKAVFKYSFARNIGEKFKNNQSDNELKAEIETFLLEKILEKEGGVFAIKYALQATRE